MLLDTSRVNIEEAFNFKTSDMIDVKGFHQTPEERASSFFSVPGKDYTYFAAYESYIQNKIDNEKRIINSVNAKLLNESAVILEAKTSENIKAKWKKLMEFLKGIFSKFIENMDHFFKSEKDYCEKYKDIILKKKPKEDMEYSYTGNYVEAMNRITKQQLPIFNWGAHYEKCNQESPGPLLQFLLPKFNYDDNESLETQCKEYFLVTSEGQKTGHFSDLNFTDMYNVVTGKEQAEKIIKNDQNALEKSTATIDTAIKDAIKKSMDASNAEKATGNEDGAEKPEGKPGEANSQPTQATTVQGSEQQKTQSGESKGQSTPWGNMEHSAIDRGTNARYIREDDNGNKPATSTTLKVSSSSSSSSSSNTGGESTNPGKQISSYKNGSDVSDKDKADNVAAAGHDANATLEENLNTVSKITDRWIEVCRAIITSKLTAYEQIVKDYMNIIRAHVRSYGGQDKKSTEGNQSAKAATKYGGKETTKNNENNIKNNEESMNDVLDRYINNAKGQDKQYLERIKNSGTIPTGQESYIKKNYPDLIKFFKK